MRGVRKRESRACQAKACAGNAREGRKEMNVKYIESLETRVEKLEKMIKVLEERIKELEKAGKK
jgi:uncharacterized protein YceH (UPF0502 family)